MSQLNSVSLWDTLLIDQLTLIELKCTRIMMPTLDMFHCIVHMCWLCSTLALPMYAWHLAAAPYAASLLQHGKLTFQGKLPK